MKISIIIPAYNAEGWIAESLESAINQTCPDLEVLVVDDGSTDNTAEIVASFSDPRIRLIRQANQGQSAAINRGVTDSQGEYIRILDADDWLNPEHITAQLRVLEGYPDCVAACRWGYFVDAANCPAVREEAANRDYVDPLEWLVDSLTKDEGMMGGWKWLIPRNIWELAGGWDERLSLNNDFDFSIRLLLAARGVRFAPEAVYSYRKGVQGALSGSRGQRAMTSAFLTTESGCRHLLAREESPRIRRICADRWQRWLYAFYPEYPELAAKAESEVARLGGSSLKLEGGRMLRILRPVLGWRMVRKLQTLAYRTAWKSIVQWKANARLKRLHKASAKNPGETPVH